MTVRITINSWAGNVMVDEKELRALLRSAGNDVKSKTARLIGRTSGGGREYRYNDHPYLASLPGQAPVVRSGTMRASLKTYVFKSGLGFAVRAREFYALFLEVGAKGGGNPGKRGATNRRTGRRVRARGVYTRRLLEPRPFLDAVMTREQPNLERRIGDAIRKGLKWKATK